MICKVCGSYNVDEGTDNYDPNVDKPPYEKPEAVLRQEARMDDWWFFRTKMTQAKNVATKRLIYSWWDEFAELKYGPDRGLDCSLPAPTKWDKELLVEDWWETKVA